MPEADADVALDLPVEAVGRNPGASGKILVQSILGMALAEAVAFYVIFLA